MSSDKHQALLGVARGIPRPNKVREIPSLGHKEGPWPVGEGPGGRGGSGALKSPERDRIRVFPDPRRRTIGERVNDAAGGQGLQRKSASGSNRFGHF